MAEIHGKPTLFESRDFSLPGSVYSAMKNHRTLVLLLLLLLPAALLRAATPSPADYTIAVHVTSTELTPTGTVSTQRIAAVIDGKTYFLMRNADNAALRIGNYKARIVEDKPVRPEEYYRIYEFLFQDGKTAKFWVAGESE